MLLAQARCLLVRQSAPRLSEIIQGRTSHSPDLAGLTEKADDLLNRAIRALDEIESKDDSEDDVHRRQRAEILRSFSAVFAALARGAGSDDDRRNLIAACAELAPYFDDANKPLAESAKLWQAVAYRIAGRPERALQILRPILTPPASAHLGFLFRVERARALADRGDDAAAIALSLRLSARVEAWFQSDTPEARHAAERTLLRLRGDFYRRWSKKLKSTGEDELAKNAEDQAAKIDEIDRRDAEPAAAIGLTESIAGLPENIHSDSAEPTPRKPDPSGQKD